MDAPKSPATVTQGQALVVYSVSGGGKTYLFHTLPPEETFIVDLEAGLDTLRSRGVTTPAITVTSSAQLQKLMGVIKRRGKLRTPEGHSVDFTKIRFIGGDSITELEKVFLYERMNKRDLTFARQPEYTETTQLMQRWLREFRDLRLLGYHVVLTALETAHEMKRDEKTGTATYRIGPLLQRKMSDQGPGLFDMVARLVCDTDGARVLLFECTDNSFVAKRRNAHIQSVEPADLGALFRKLDATRAAVPAVHLQDTTVADIERCRVIAKKLGIPPGNVDEMMKRHKDSKSVLTFFEAMHSSMRILDAPTDAAAKAAVEDMKRGRSGLDAVPPIGDRRRPDDERPE